MRKSIFHSVLNTSFTFTVANVTFPKVNHGNYPGNYFDEYSFKLKQKCFHLRPSLQGENLTR